MRVKKTNKISGVLGFFVLCLSLASPITTNAAAADVTIVFSLLQNGQSNNVQLVNTAANEITATVDDMTGKFIFAPNSSIRNTVNSNASPKNSCDDVSYSCLFYPTPDIVKNIYFFQFAASPSLRLTDTGSASIMSYNTETKLMQVGGTGPIEIPTTGPGTLPGTTPISHYITGKVTLESTNEIIPYIPIKAYKLDPEKGKGDEISVYSVFVAPGTGDPKFGGTIGGSLGTNGADGVFAAKDKNMQDLPPGTYSFEVDVTSLTLMESIKKNGSAALLTSTCLIIPGCPALGAAAFMINDAVNGQIHYVAYDTVTVDDNGKFAPDPFVLELRMVRISAMAKALASAIGTLGSWVQVSLKWTMGAVVDLLENTADFVVGTTDCQGSACGMIGPWTAMRNIGLGLLVMALIIIAFANVLQIDIEQYGMNRMIPKIIISIFLAFTSWTIVLFFFDFTKAIQDQAIALLDTGGGGGYGGLNFLQSLSISTPSAGNVLANSGSFILLLCILIGTLVAGVVLLFTLVIRIVMLSFLVAVAPLAFILNIVPFTSKLYKQWWSEFFKWMFMGPVALVIISLGAVIAASATGSGGGFGDTITMDSAISSGDGGSRLFVGLIIFAAAMYMGATYPMQQGGNIMKSFTKGGKKLAGWAGNQSGVSGAFRGMTSAMADKRQRGMESRANTLLNTASLGKYGIDKDVYRKNQKAALLDAESKRFGFEKKEEFTNAYNSAHGETAKQAILLAGMRKGMIDDGALGSEVARQAESDETGLLMTAAMKENRESLILHGDKTTAQKASEDVIKKYSSAKPNEIGAISTRLADATKPAISASGLGKYSGSITQQNIDKLKETQGSAYSESLSKMLYDVHGAPQKAFDENTARDAAVINAAHTEAEAENARRDAATTSASAAASAQRQAQLNQASTRADSDARGRATVQDEAQRTNDNL